MDCCNNGWKRPPKDEFEICQKCGKDMAVKYSGFVIDTYPETHTWYWECECGHTMAGAHISDNTVEVWKVGELSRVNE